MSKIEEHAHVHFEEKDELADQSIRVKKMATNKAIVHLGLLLINHRYEIQFKFPKDCLPKTNDFDLVQHDENDVPNKNCRLISIENKESDEVLLTVELITYKEKLQKDTLFIKPKNDDVASKTEIILQSRVLGKGKGTPMLHEGIRSLESLPDPEESECGSDWQGFE